MKQKPTKEMESRLREIISYWAGRLDLPLPWFKRNNKTKFMGYVDYYLPKRQFWFNYNFKRIMDSGDEADFFQFLFHELAHIKFKTYKWRSKEGKIEAEYVAEKFSLECLKKYFSKFYKRNVENTKAILKDKTFAKKFPVHYEAFKRIEDYSG